jgi:uncharacterized protein YdaU (DUF1376 family)
LNYYERHIGDYIKDTAHLSLLEHGVYTRLLDVYYLREQGIPKDQVYRLVSAASKAEKAAVDSVLREYFQLHDGHWVQGRCQDVIAEYHAFVEKQRAAGKASGAKRALNQRSTTVEPALDSGSTKTQPPTSHLPLPTTQDRKKEPTAAAPPCPGWFDDFKAVYPKRAGDQGWPKALRAANARIAEGHDPIEFLNGAERYAAYCLADETAGTKYVKQAATFLGPDKPFLLPWVLPLTKAQARQDANVAASLAWLENTDAAN